MATPRPRSLLAAHALPHPTPPGLRTPCPLLPLPLLPPASPVAAVAAAAVVAALALAVAALRCAARQVIVTPHSAFLTKEALANIATSTCQNIADYLMGRPLVNEVVAKK